MLISSTDFRHIYSRILFIKPVNIISNNIIDVDNKPFDVTKYVTKGMEYIALNKEKIQILSNSFLTYNIPIDVKLDINSLFRETQSAIVTWIDTSENYAEILLPMLVDIDDIYREYIIPYSDRFLLIPPNFYGKLYDIINTICQDKKILSYEHYLKLWSIYDKNIISKLSETII